MTRNRAIRHAGREIVLLDYRDVTDADEILRGIAAAYALIERYPPHGSLLTLTDVRGARYNADVMAALKKFGAHNKPYVKAAAVLATSPTHRVAITAVALFAGRVMRGFDDEQAAKDWLVRQK